MTRLVDRPDADRSGDAPGPEDSATSGGPVIGDGSRLPRVLFVIGTLERGGSEGQLVSLLERIHGTRVYAALLSLTPGADASHERQLEAARVPLRLVGGERSRIVRLGKSVRTLVRVLRAVQPDLVYVWLEESALLAAPVARAFGIPVALARRNISGGYASRPAAIVAAIHAAERLAVLATANSEAVAAETRRRGISPGRVRVVPNGQVVPRPLPLPSTNPVVLGYVARMRPDKGHLRLLHSLAAINTEVPWRVDLAGDGPWQDHVAAEAARLGLNGRMRFLGRVSDMLKFWRMRDVAVLLSDHEGCPNALIEAALLGRPMVATAVGGVPEMVDETVGALVDPDDPVAIAGALQRLIEDADLRRRLGAAARERAIERYSMDAFVEGHLAAIGEALQLAGR
jgi:glycosyltransferase involved in cell wall biosynthesis